MISVAIDGPAGAGKSTLARRLAADFGYIYVDTGAMFRTIGLYALRAGKDPKDNEAVNALLPNITLEFAFIEGEQHIYLNGEDVSTAIRTEEVGLAASVVAAYPSVRAELLDLQRRYAQAPGLVADGRAMASVVFPDAPLKVFLTATPEARAMRRYNQLIEKGISANLSNLPRDLAERDRRDRERAVAPCVPAADAHVLDSSDLTIEETVDQIMAWWRKLPR